MDLALNNLQKLICHKTQQNKQTNFLFLILLLPSQLSCSYKVLHYIGNAKYSLAAPIAFAEVIKMTNHTRL